MRTVYLVLLNLICLNLAYAGKMTIYVYPPSKKMDWRSPRGLLKSMESIMWKRTFNGNHKVKFTNDEGEQERFSSNYYSAMGHTIVHIECPNYDKWVSMSGQNFKSVDTDLAFDKKLGMGVLFENYLDGHIISGRENVERLINYDSMEGAKPRYLSVPISDAACGRVSNMAEYFKSFNLHKDADLMQYLQRETKNKNLYFGLIDPYTSYHERKRQCDSREPGANSCGANNEQYCSVKLGGGCAPFAAALLKESGCFDAGLDNFWKREVKVSEKLIGGTIDPKTGKRREVNFWDLTKVALGGQWEYEGYENRTVKMYDPALIWDFIGNLKSCKAGSVDCDPNAEKWLKDSGRSVAEGAPHHYEGTTEQRESLNDFYAKTKSRKHSRPKKSISSVDIEGVELSCGQSQDSQPDIASAETTPPAAEPTRPEDSHSSPEQVVDAGTNADSAPSEELADADAAPTLAPENSNNPDFKYWFCRAYPNEASCKNN